MDFSSRTAALFEEIRRQRNGAVASSMRLYGAQYGRNYGVSLPTVRALAAIEGCDHDFARYLYRQNVRELRLLALHLAQPERITTDERDFWTDGIINSELAEEAAFTLLSRVAGFSEWFGCLLSGCNPLLQYAALLAGARSAELSAAWIEPTLDAVRRAATAAETTVGEVCGLEIPSARPTGSSAALRSPLSGVRLVSPFVVSSAKFASDGEALAPSTPAISPKDAARLTAHGAVALLAACAGQNAENRLAILRAADSLGATPSEDFVHEELAWRLEA